MTADTWRLLERLIAARHGVIGTAEAQEAGVSQHALRWARRQDRLVTLRRGFHTSAERWARASARDRHVLRVLAHQRADPSLIACGVSAAVVLNLPTPDGPPPAPLLSRPRRASAPRPARGRRNGTLHRTAFLATDEVVRTVDAGVRLTSPVRTVIDCAAAWEPPWGLAVVDAALHRGLVTAEDLRSGAAAPGVRAGARWAVRHGNAAVESPLESLARAHIVLAGFPEPTPQVWLDTRLGRFRVDLLDESAHVITEADGKVKYTTPDAVWQEKRRQDALREGGNEVVRFTMADHHRPTPWLEAYARAVGHAQRAWPRPAR